MKLGTLVIDYAKDLYVVTSPQHKTWASTGRYLPDALRNLAQRIENEALEHFEDELSWPKEGR